MSSKALEQNQAVAYLAAIAAGIVLGAVGPSIGEGLEFLIYPALGALLLVTFLQVPFAKLAESTRDSRFLGGLILLNFVVVPPVAWALSRFAGDTAVELGVLMVLLVPCVDYVIVFTRMAGGDATRLLASTPLLMLVQILLLPAYLWIFLGPELADLVETGPFVRTFLLLILLPLGLAWTLQAISKRSLPVRRAVRWSVLLPVPLMVATLFVVAASQSPRAIDDLGLVAGTIPVFVAFMALMLGVGTWFTRLTGFAARRARAVVFSGITRNGLVVLPLALALEAGGTLTAAVIVTQVLVEVIGLVLLLRVIPRMFPG